MLQIKMCSLLIKKHLRTDLDESRSCCVFDSYSLQSPFRTLFSVQRTEQQSAAASDSLFESETDSLAAAVPSPIKGGHGATIEKERRTRIVTDLRARIVKPFESFREERNLQNSIRVYWFLGLGTYCILFFSYSGLTDRTAARGRRQFCRTTLNLVVSPLFCV